jgi:hypothetical protein
VHTLAAGGEVQRGSAGIAPSAAAAWAPGCPALRLLRPLCPLRAHGCLRLQARTPPLLEEAGYEQDEQLMAQLRWAACNRHLAARWRRLRCVRGEVASVRHVSVLCNLLLCMQTCAAY